MSRREDLCGPKEREMAGVISKSSLVENPALPPSKSNAQSEASCARPVKWLQEDGWSWFERGADKKRKVVGLR